LIGWRLWEGGGNGFVWSFYQFTQVFALAMVPGISTVFTFLLYCLVSVFALRHFTGLSWAQMDESLFPKCLETDSELWRGLLPVGLQRIYGKGYGQQYLLQANTISNFPDGYAVIVTLAMTWKHDCHL
jgi:hypothetical protein